MKKLMIITLLISGFTVQAQRHDRHGPHRATMSDMTPEQIATLKTKRLDLRLDLNEEQQTSIMALELEQARKFKARMEDRKNTEGEPQGTSPDDRFNRQNLRLNRQLAYKDAMKNILTEEQYTRWDKMRFNGKGKRHHARGHTKREGN